MASKVFAMVVSLLASLRGGRRKSAKSDKKVHTPSDGRVACCVWKTQIHWSDLQSSPHWGMCNARRMLSFPGCRWTVASFSCLRATYRAFVVHNQPSKKIFNKTLKRAKRLQNKGIKRTSTWSVTCGDQEDNKTERSIVAMIATNQNGSTHLRQLW